MKKLIKKDFTFGELVELNVKYKKGLIKDNITFTNDIKQLVFKKFNTATLRDVYYDKENGIYKFFYKSKEVETRIIFGSMLEVLTYKRSGNLTENHYSRKEHYVFQ